MALSWKVGTAVKNLVLPAFGTAKRIGWANWWKGLARLVAGKVSYKEFREADFIQRRVDAGYSPEVRAALTRLQSEKPTRLRLLIEDGMQIHGKADALSTALGAAISFDYHFQGLVESGLPREHAQREALLLAEDDVRRTAQPVELAERSLTELSASDTGRILWMFSSDPRKNTALVIEAARHAYRDARAAGKGTVGAMLSAAAVKELRAVWVTSWIIDGLLNTLINTVLRDLRDDDDDEWLDEKNWNPRNIILGTLFGPITGVPLLGELASGFDSGPLSTTVRGLASLATLAEALVTLDIPDQHENEPYEWLEKHLVSVLNGVGIFFRSDLASAANIGDQIFKYADGLFDTPTEAGAKQLRKEAREKRKAKEAVETDASRAAKEADAARRKEQKRREIEAAAERRARD